MQPEGAQPTSGTVVDLMAALRASVDAAKAKQGGAADEAPRKAAPRKAAKKAAPAKSAAKKSTSKTAAKASPKQRQKTA